MQISSNISQSPIASRMVLMFILRQYILTNFEKSRTSYTRMQFVKTKCFTFITVHHRFEQGEK